MHPVVMNYEIRILSYNKISTQQARDVRLRNSPGVYAWYRDINLDPYLNSEDAFLAAIDSLLSANLSDGFKNKIGLLYELTLTERSGQLSPRKQNWLREICSYQEGRSIVSKILRSSNPFQSPLYIGKSINIRYRITEHLNSQSDLLERLENASIDITKCYIKIMYLESDEIELISKFANREMEDMALLFEDLLTRISPSAFVRRSG